MTKEEIGHIIKESRLAAGLTQLQVAEALGRPQQTVANWELGRSQPDANTLFSLFGVLGRSVDEAFGFSTKKAPALSGEALTVARGYDGLDRHGKTAVKLILDEEQRRMEEAHTGEPDRTVPLYLTPAAAGYTSPAFGEDFEEIAVNDRRVDFAVKIDGDSMAPTLQDGDVAYVERAPLEDGDVGVFCLNGDMLCKQYRREENGVVRLVSLNRARADADRTVGEDDTLTCFGRVILQ